MDPTLAQPFPEDVPIEPISPLKKFLPLILGGVLILLLILGSLLLFSPAKESKKAVVTPTVRPTATPFPPPTMPMVTKAAATRSAELVKEKIGRLVFIKDGNIYNSDFASFSLLVKNATPAADRLSWSPQGNLLAWRPTSPAIVPRAVTIYNRQAKSAFFIQPSDYPETELVDYAWSGDEKQLAVLYHDQSYHIDLFSTASSSAQTLPLLNRIAQIRQIVWPDSNTIVFLGEDGISSMALTNPTPKLLVENKAVQKMKLSKDKTKLLYSVGTDAKSDLYIINIDGSGARLIPVTPAKIDMGTTNLPPSILNNGFLPYGLWFPTGDKLMVGYHYLTNLPLVGVYDLTNNSFTALSVFALYENDFLVDDLRLMGSRVNTQTTPPSWQVAFFTIEDNAKLATVRVIPDASSPAFFGDDLLPLGNVF